MDGCSLTTQSDASFCTCSNLAHFSFQIKADGTLDLTGQFLALPVVSCDNQEQTSTSQNSGFVVQGGLFIGLTLIILIRNVYSFHTIVDSYTLLTLQV